MAPESRPVALARQSLAYYLKNQDVLPVQAEIPAEFQGRAGAFVSLKKAGELRGCIGTFQPTRTNIAEEIIYNAISAGTQDPRFWPIPPAELPELSISVDVLAAPEPVPDQGELDPQRYGVIVRRGRRSGLLLPMLAGVNSAAEQSPNKKPVLAKRKPWNFTGLP